MKCKTVVGEGYCTCTKYDECDEIVCKTDSLSNDDKTNPKCIKRTKYTTDENCLEVDVENLKDAVTCKTCKENFSLFNGICVSTK